MKSTEELAAARKYKLDQYNAMLTSNIEERFPAKKDEANPGLKPSLIKTAKNLWHATPLDRLISIQPITEPTGLVYQLRYQHRDLDGKGTLGYTLEVCTEFVEVARSLVDYCLSIEVMQDTLMQDGSCQRDKVAHKLADSITYNEICMVNLVATKDEPVAAHKKPKDFSVGFLSKPDYTGQFVRLALTIHMKAVTIADDTYRGAGNVAVVGMDIASAILKDDMNAPAAVWAPGHVTGVPSMFSLGTLNGTIQVFGSNAIAPDSVLVGYKGHSSEIDAGYFYAPFFLDSDLIVDPVTFQPKVTFNHYCARGRQDPDGPSNKYYRTFTFGGFPKCSKEEVENIASAVTENNLIHLKAIRESEDTQTEE